MQISILNLFLTLFCLLSYSITLSSQSISEKSETSYQQALKSNNIYGYTPKMADESYNEKTKVRYVYVKIYKNSVPLRNYIGILAYDEHGELLYSDLPIPERSIQEYNYSEKEAEEMAAEALELLLPNKYSNIQNSITFKNRRAVLHTNDGNIPDLQEYHLTYRPEYVQHNQDFIPAYVYTIKKNNSWEEYEVKYDLNENQFFGKLALFKECHFEEQTSPAEVHEKHVPFKCINAVSGTKGQYFSTSLPDVSVLDGLKLHTENSDFIASPFGWHDLNGEGEEDTTGLAGNNVSVITDRDGDREIDEEFLSPDLVFDQEPDLTSDPVTYQKATATNLFIITNQIHDIMYNNGFDDASGNFQHINYYGEGEGDDAVNVFNQFDADNGPGNNAFFSPSREGNSPSMFMLTWSGSTTENKLSVQSPQYLMGDYPAVPASFGPQITSEITDTIILVEDLFSPANDGCEEITNDIEGKIAVISRGLCEFDRKVELAEESGAIAAIIINTQGRIFPMPGELDVGIPSIMIDSETGYQLKSALSSDQTVVLTLQPFDTNIPNRDAAYENTITIHEYAHGITSRLVGGPDEVGCLYNGEQMGEGWSDIIALLLTMNESNKNRITRGIGGYALYGSEEGSIRSKLYSPDLSINDHTYINSSFNNGSPHALGEVWATMLWDLTRELIDRYGFNQNLILGNGGNRRALYLITEALKMTPCNPGFVDGRDAILQADEFLYGGENHCLIWKVFARRGLGFSADQGNTFQSEDAIEAFDLPPQCATGISVIKNMTDEAFVGDTIDVKVQVQNNFSSERTITLEDKIPNGLKFLSGSGNIPLTSQGTIITNDNEIILPARNTLIVNYKMIVEESETSFKIYTDSLLSENSEMNYTITSLSGEDPIGSEFTTEEAFTGEYSFHLNHTMNSEDIALISDVEFDNLSQYNQPTLRFSHKYDFVTGFEGAIPEVSTNGGQNLGIYGANGIQK